MIHRSASGEGGYTDVARGSKTISELLCAYGSDQGDQDGRKLVWRFDSTSSLFESEMLIMFASFEKLSMRRE